MKYFIYILLFIVVSQPLCMSQDTILLVTGKKVFLQEYKIDESMKKLFYNNKRGNEKSFYLDNVYSVINSNGKQNIIYNPNKNQNFNFTEIEMKDFVQGAIDSRNEYKAPHYTLFGFVFGTGYSIIIQNPIYAIFPTGLSNILISMPKKSRKTIEKRHPEYKENDHYILGYNQEVKNKRFVNSIKGACVGIIVGIAGLVLQHNEILPSTNF